MRISFLRKKEVPEFSRLVRRIVNKTPYYSSAAKAHIIQAYLPNVVRKDLQSRNFIYIVARAGNKLVGFQSGELDGGAFWSDWIGVDGKLRRKGVATAIDHFLEKKLRKLRAHKIWCDSRTNNKESIAYLKKHSFRKVCLLKNHWHRQDYYLWQKFI